MGIFNKKKKKETAPSGLPEMCEVSLTKVFDSNTLSPLEFRHTQKYFLDGYDPLSAERERLKGLPADWLLKDKRIPAIKRDSAEEMAAARTQYINHMHSIQPVIDKRYAEYCRAKNTIARINAEIAEYDAEIAELTELKKYESTRRIK